MKFQLVADQRPDYSVSADIEMTSFGQLLQAIRMHFNPSAD